MISCQEGLLSVAATACHPILEQTIGVSHISFCPSIRIDIGFESVRSGVSPKPSNSLEKTNLCICGRRGSNLCEAQWRPL